jgi:outer membrane protein TolC
MVPAPSSSDLFRGQQTPGAARVTTGVSTLSVSQAIEIATQNNLATLLAKERRREAKGFETETLAGLLPNLSATAYQADLTENLAALGFRKGTIPGFTSTFIGPFKNFDARARLEQNIFSFSAIRTFQAGRANVRVAEMEEELAREQVAIATSLAYLQASRAGAAIAAAQANVELAQTLVTLAEDQHKVGIATGVDVIRAQTRLAQEQVRQANAQTEYEDAYLQLQRIVGLSLGSSLTLTDPLTFAVETLPGLDTAIAQAAETRPELRVANAQLIFNSYQARAAQAELLPSLEFLADYGVSGITPVTSALPTRRVAIQLNVPIFNGGLTFGKIQVARSQQTEAELQLASIRGQVEDDVRLAFAALRTNEAAVHAADLALNLAEREMDMARDRYRAGVGDNIELVTAQAALSNARLDRVNALALFNAARLNFAASQGRARLFHW